MQLFGTPSTYSLVCEVDSISACGEGDMGSCDSVLYWPLPVACVALLSHNHMTYFRGKPWLSHRMNLEIAKYHIHLDWIFLRGNTYLYYISAFTNHMILTPERDSLGSVWCCLLSPIVMSVCKKGKAEQQFPSFLNCITNLGGRHCIVGCFRVNKQ